MSSIVVVTTAAASPPPTLLSEPCRLPDLRLSVRWRSSRKLGWPLGEVGGDVAGRWTSMAVGMEAVPLLRRATVGGGVFFKEARPALQMLAALDWGWGLTTATREALPSRSAGKGGGGGRSLSSGGGGKG